MRLNRYSYTIIDFPDHDDWNLHDVHLQDLNLIVGKNSVGKSRALRILSSFASMLTQDENFYTGEWNFTFVNNKQQKVLYLVTTELHNVIKEKLSVDGHVVLERDAGHTKLYSQTKEKIETISPPDDKLVIHSRRDKEEYPFLEELIDWAQHTHSCYFGQINPKAFLSVDAYGKQIMTIEDIPSIIDRLSPGPSIEIINDFNKLGCRIENFYSKSTGNQDFLYIKEKVVAKQ